MLVSSELIDLANHSLPNIKNRFEELLNQVEALENEKATLNSEILGLRNCIYTNNEILRKKNQHLHTLDRKLRQLEVMLETANKDLNHYKIKEIVDQRLNDKRLLLVTALLAVLQTLKANPYGLNLLNSPSFDIEDYTTNDFDGRALLQFAESCYNNLLMTYAKTIA